MPDRRIRKIVILGGGTAGWMTAAALAKVNSPPQFTLTLIESEEIGTIGVGEATIPTIHWFNRLIDGREHDFVASHVDNDAASGEIRDWLRVALARLNPRIAEMFALRFFEGKDNPEIAELLNTTPGTVAVTLSRTRDRLEKEYRAYQGGVA